MDIIDISEQIDIASEMIEGLQNARGDLVVTRSSVSQYEDSMPTVGKAFTALDDAISDAMANLEERLDRLEQTQQSIGY